VDQRVRDGHGATLRFFSQATISPLTVILDGVLSLEYDQTYRVSRGAVPLSLSMPTGRRDHPPQVVRAFCRGLLPDNDAVLERWGRDFQVSPGNPFALLGHVGEDAPAPRNSWPTTASSSCSPGRAP